MSDSMKSSQAFMSLVDLNELNEPHKLAKWFTILPKYKKAYFQAISTPNTNITDNKPSPLTPINSNIDDQDINICQLFSKFVYQNQLCGKHLKYSFPETQFKSILSIILNNNDYTYSEYEWLWDIIKQSQSINNNIESNIYKINKPKIPWILSSWNQFQLIQQDEIYHNPSYNNNITKMTKPQSKSIENGKCTKSNTDQYERKEVEYKIKSDDHDMNNKEGSKSENNEDPPTPAFKQLDQTQNSNNQHDHDHDEEFASRDTKKYTSSDDKLHHEDEQYEQEIADETDMMLVKTDSEKQQKKQLNKPKYKGNRQRLGTDSFTESDDLQFIKSMSSQNRTKEVDSKKYQTIPENEQDTDIDHDRTGGTTNGGPTITKRGNEDMPKGGICNGCVIL